MKLYSILFISLIFTIITYGALNICNYINENDDQNINCSRVMKILLSIFNAILSTIIYIKLKESTLVILYIFLWILIFITAYIDYSTKYIYEITSRPLLVISSILFISNLIIGITNLKEIIWLITPILVIILFSKLNYIGKGDVDVYIGIMISFVNFKMAIILIIFSMGMSGFISIFLLILKKVNLNYRKPLCPSIAIATYIILILT